MDSQLEERLTALEARLAGEPEALRKKPGRVVDDVLAALDEGTLRVCEPAGEEWIVHAWVKRAMENALPATLPTFTGVSGAPSAACSAG